MFPRLFFFHSLEKRSRYFSFFSLSFNFNLFLVGMATSTILQVCILLIMIRSNHLAEIRWSVCTSNPRGIYESRSPGEVLSCAYTICSYGHILISFTVLSGSLCPLSPVKSDILSGLVCCTRLLCDWSFRLYHHIIYISCFPDRIPGILSSAQTGSDWKWESPTMV